MKVCCRCHLMQSDARAKGLTGIPKNFLLTLHQAECKPMQAESIWEVSLGTNHKTWTCLRAVRLARAVKELPWTVPQPVRSRCCKATSADMACSIEIKANQFSSVHSDCAEERHKKDYNFRRLIEKPRIRPGCPGQYDEHFSHTHKNCIFHLAFSETMQM